MAKETFVRSASSAEKLITESTSTLSQAAQTVENTLEQTLNAVVQSSDTLLSVAEVLAKISA